MVGKVEKKKKSQSEAQIRIIKKCYVEVYLLFPLFTCSFFICPPLFPSVVCLSTYYPELYFSRDNKQYSKV